MNNDNKLIAEFMGWTPCDPNDSTMYTNPTNGALHSSHSDMRFHTSWDWLMPVVQKCFDTQQPEEGQHYFINESLLTMKIEVVYDRVVEFIKEVNELT